MGGRRPLPSALKRLKGARPSRLNPAEPQPNPGSPPTPTQLSGEALAQWHRIAALASDMRTLTVADGPALELVACAFAEYVAAVRVLGRLGSTYATQTPTGSTMRRPRPEVAIAADAWRRALQGLAHFGLSPATRAKVSAAPAEPESRLRRFTGSGPRRFEVVK